VQTRINVFLLQDIVKLTGILLTFGVVRKELGLLAWAVFYIINVYEQEGVEAPEERKAETEEVAIGFELLTTLTGRRIKVKNPCVSFALGIIMPLVTADFLVRSAVNIASLLGASELFLGITFVALGTSFADIATAVAASRKGHGDLAVAGCLGANLFTLLIVLGPTTLTSPLQIPSKSLWLGGSVFLITATLLSIYIWSR
jgi:cation:H+ antiporter